MGNERMDGNTIADESYTMPETRKERRIDGWDGVGEMIEIENNQGHRRTVRPAKENTPMGKEKWKMVN